MKRMFLILGLLAGLAGCTNEEGTEHVLRVAGYKNVETLGYKWFACDEGGTCTKFTATAPDGEQVMGHVSCGFFFRGCTIHIN